MKIQKNEEKKERQVTKIKVLKEEENRKKKNNQKSR